MVVVAADWHCSMIHLENAVLSAWSYSTSRICGMLERIKLVKNNQYKMYIPGVFYFYCFYYLYFYQATRCVKKIEVYFSKKKLQKKKLQNIFGIKSPVNQLISKHMTELVQMFRKRPHNHKIYNETN